ncbi:hypothetical protein F4553_004220 [Allocatelliglobosispora scoriae]|uniref:DUF8083 domain-containing protein n=1 Tax=Allocatelliglobosispora scoriae TaxID=643052 RepID=A0A841BVS2_9ACTN|nr:hypothetical protein [Allocatelliglobosispora scoriae]MBB5870841.1 hypothetical protein [Allocatelliglobosispora scoriae]
MPSQFAAYLRVYEPLAAFDRDRQRYWRRYLEEGRAVGPAEGPGRQRVSVLEALGAGWTRLPDLPEEAYVLQTEGGTLICPWNLRVRVAEAALIARDGVPAVLADAFVPPALAGVARTVLDDFRSGAKVLDHGVPRLHEHVATWGVPLRWFLFVDPAEREVSTQSGRRMLRYRTEIGQARRRAHKGLAVLRRSMGDAPITEAVAEGTRWLEEFHPGSMVELDYGGLVHLFSDEALLGDDSPELVATGIAGLARGDAEAAAEAYEELIDRWRQIQLMERCN